jgi:hypothetical protein
VDHGDDLDRVASYALVVVDEPIRAWTEPPLMSGTSSSVPEAGGEPSCSSRPIAWLPFLSVTSKRYIMNPLLDCKTNRVRDAALTVLV